VALGSSCPQVLHFIDEQGSRGAERGNAERITSHWLFHCCPALPCQSGGIGMNHLFYELFRDEQGQDIAEYAVMLAVILVIVVGTIRLIGSNANNVFSQVASSIQ
jgi:Flp pilus assembly pilin Flp